MVISSAKLEIIHAFFSALIPVLVTGMRVWGAAVHP